MLSDGAIIGISIACGVVFLLVVLPAILYKFFPAFLIRGFTKLAAMWAGLETKRIDAGGYNWCYYESADNPFHTWQETIVLIHGYGTNKESWSTFSRYLVQKRYRVIAPDLVGNGYTTPLEADSYAVIQQVIRLDAFLDAVLGPEKFHLVGLSMGGHIAGVYAATYPSKVQTLCLMCPAGARGETLSKLAEGVLVHGGPNPLIIQTADDMKSLLKHVFYKVPWIPTGVLTYFLSEKIQRQDIDRKIVADLEPDELASGLARALPNVEAPTMLVWGDKDELIDVSCVPVIENALRERPFTVILKDAGHALNAERPDEVAKWYLAFLEARRFPGGLAQLERALRESTTVSGSLTTARSLSSRSSIQSGRAPVEVNRFVLPPREGSVSSELGLIDESDSQAQRVSVGPVSSINPLPVARSSSFKGGAAFPPVRLDSFSSMHEAAAPPSLQPEHKQPDREEQKESYNVHPTSPSIKEHPSPSPSTSTKAPSWHDEQQKISVSVGPAGKDEHEEDWNSNKKDERISRQPFEQSGRIHGTKGRDSTSWHEDKIESEESTSDKKDDRRNDSSRHERAYERV